MVLAVQVLEMVCKVLHLFLVLSAQRAVVLGEEIAALAVLVALVVVLQMVAREARQHLGKVMLAALAQALEMVQPQQAAAAAVQEQ